MSNTVIDSPATDNDLLQALKQGMGPTHYVRLFLGRMVLPPPTGRTVSITRARLVFLTFPQPMHYALLGQRHQDEHLLVLQGRDPSNEPVCLVRAGRDSLWEMSRSIKADLTGSAALRFPVEAALPQHTARWLRNMTSAATADRIPMFFVGPIYELLKS